MDEMNVQQIEKSTTEADESRRNELPAILTAEELAAFLRVNRKTVYEMIARQQLPGCVRVGRTVRVSSKSILDWLDGKPVLLPTKKARR